VSSLEHVAFATSFKRIILFLSVTVFYVTSASSLYLSLNLSLSFLLSQSLMVPRVSVDTDRCVTLQHVTSPLANQRCPLSPSAQLYDTCRHFKYRLRTEALLHMPAHHSLSSLSLIILSHITPLILPQHPNLRARGSWL
jgi:hypothetical protein